MSYPTFLPGKSMLSTEFEVGCVLQWVCKRWPGQKLKHAYTNRCPLVNYIDICKSRLNFHATCHIVGEELRQALLVNVKLLFATETALVFMTPWKVSSRLHISYNARYTVCVNICRNIMVFIFFRF